MTLTSERLKEIMKERNLKQIDILNKSEKFQKELGIKMSKSHLSQYVNGKSSPDQHKLFLLSKTLGVSEAWLMGYDVPKQSFTLGESTEQYNTKNSHVETIAAHIDEDISEEQMKDIIKYIEFVKTNKF
ncbi:helix-turn-helix domain-containing protein [Macrococcus capreoli]|uniref:helix-turn-helix domain-containing protein n=1 Tax=Macrococcus capreoli TaxID=2982690 RepID=UPI003EE7C67C